MRDSDNRIPLFFVGVGLILVILALVIVGATWCPPCRAEMPLLETFFRKYASEGFVLIGVNAGESITEVVEFVETYNLSFPMWLDKDGQALRAFRSNALPSSYVIDHDGSVRFAWLGAITEKLLEDNVTPLIFEAD